MLICQTVINRIDKREMKNMCSSSLVTLIYYIKQFIFIISLLMFRTFMVNIVKLRAIRSLHVFSISLSFLFRLVSHDHKSIVVGYHYHYYF